MLHALQALSARARGRAVRCLFEQRCGQTSEPIGVKWRADSQLFERKESEKFRRFPLDALLARDKVNLDIFWLKDDTLGDPDLLPPPDEISAEIVESLEAALELFRGVAHAIASEPERPKSTPMS